MSRQILIILSFILDFNGMHKTEKNQHLVLVIGFMIFISLPLVVNIVGISTGKTISENREVEKIPALQIDYPKNVSSQKVKLLAVYVSCVRFIRQFDNYYNNT